MTVGGPEQTLPLGRRTPCNQAATDGAGAGGRKLLSRQSAEGQCPAPACIRQPKPDPLWAGPTRPRRQAFGLSAAAPVVRLRANGRYRDPLAVPQWVDAGPWPLPGRLTRIWRCGGGLEMGYGPRDLACGQGFKL